MCSAYVVFLSLLFILTGCNSSNKEWKEYEQNAEFAKSHPNQKGMLSDSLEEDRKFEDAARAESKFAKLGTLGTKSDGTANDPYNKGYQIGFDAGVADGRGNTRGTRGSIDAEGLGFYGTDAVKYQEGYNTGYEDGFARCSSGTDNDSGEDVKAKARQINDSYLKTTGAEISKEENKAREAAEKEVKAKQAERETIRKEIEKEAYEKAKNQK